MKHYKLEAADHLLKRGISVKNVDDHGRNSLLWAIWRKHVKLAEELIEAGADVNIENPDDLKTPINYVSAHPHLKGTTISSTCSSTTAQMLTTLTPWTTHLCSSAQCTVTLIVWKHFSSTGLTWTQATH